VLHLASVRYQPVSPGASSRYPFSVPLIRSLTTLEFRTPVTILVGENGSGKSTLLEAIAAAAGCAAVGAENLQTDRTLEPARALAERLRLSWKHRTHRGFFLRSEDFFNFCRRMAELRLEMQTEVERVDREYEGRSPLAKALARGVFEGSARGIERRYGADLDANSHGESFLKLFQARFVPEGLYILDEPETPLSPSRQLALMAMIMEMVEQRSQFIIATHSPILMAYPEATILSCDQPPVQEVAYDDLEHVKLTRAFLSDPKRFLYRLREST